MVIFLYLLVFLVVWGVILSYSAYNLSTMVPVLLEAPDNYGAWFWVVSVVALVWWGASASTKVAD